MPTVNDILTNFNGPNYHGRLHATTPEDTRFLTALMGATPGGGEVETNLQSRTFEWQTYDLRDADQRTVVDGDRAGTGEHRSRQNVFNVLQTHREDIDVAYERMAQTQQFDGQNIGGDNPVSNELQWQTAQMLKQIKRDLNYSAINGTYVLPGTNATAAKTRGILEAITSNVTDAASGAASKTVATSANADDILDFSSAHGLEVGDDFYFASKTGGSGVSINTRYYVVSVPTTTSLQFSATRGGSAVDFGSDITAGEVVAYPEPDEETIDNIMQDAADNGGFTESTMGLVLVNSTLLRWLTKVYVKDKGLETRSRTVGGASVNTIVTPFGELGLMYERMMPKGTVATVSLDQCKPHHRVIPDRGVTFVEPTQKAGASSAYQVYTSFGLEYGNEAAHGKVTNLTDKQPKAA